MKKLLVLSVLFCGITACEQSDVQDKKVQDTNSTKTEVTPQASNQASAETVSAPIQGDTSKQAIETNASTSEEVAKSTSDPQNSDFKANNLKTEVKTPSEKSSDQAEIPMTSHTEKDAVSKTISEPEHKAPNVTKEISKPSISKTALKKTTSPQNKVDDGLSDEEKRVGYQRALNDREIQYLKSQCRYPFMSDKDIADYNCGTKPVIIAN